MAMIDYLMTNHLLGQSLALWFSFMSIVVILLALDLGLLNRRDEIISAKRSLIYTAGYITLAVCFGLWLWHHLGNDEDGMDYFTAYVIELSLSLDNLFIMSVIMSYFAVPRQYQHRVLFWGIMGVLVMRGLMIGFGTALIAKFSWMLFVFAGFLVLTGIKMMFMKDDADELDDSALVKFFQKHMRFTNKIHGHHFFAKLPHPETGRLVSYATPLFMALICIEFMDVLFALDSVPAVFAISSNAFVIYTSNIFAILGLRSMFFALTAVLERFKYMKYSLSIVLIFIGGKVFYNHFFGKIDPFISLGVTFAILIAGALYSVYKTRNLPPLDPA